MQVQRSQSWTVAVEPEKIGEAVEAFLRRRNLEAQRSGDTWQLKNGSHPLSRLRSPYFTPPSDLRLNGTLTVLTGQGSTGLLTRIEIEVESVPFGKFLGKGQPFSGVQERYERACDELIDDLKSCLPAAARHEPEPDPAANGGESKDDDAKDDDEKEDDDKET